MVKFKKDLDVPCRHQYVFRSCLFCFAEQVCPCNGHEDPLLLGHLSVCSTNEKVHKLFNVCGGHWKSALCFCFIVSQFEFRKVR